MNTTSAPCLVHRLDGTDLRALGRGPRLRKQHRPKSQRVRRARPTGMAHCTQCGPEVRWQGTPSTPCWGHKRSGGVLRALGQRPHLRKGAPACDPFKGVEGGNGAACMPDGHDALHPVWAGGKVESVAGVLQVSKLVEFTRSPPHICTTTRLSKRYHTLHISSTALRIVDKNLTECYTVCKCLTHCASIPSRPFGYDQV